MPREIVSERDEKARLYFHVNVDVSRPNRGAMRAHDREHSADFQIITRSDVFFVFFHLDLLFV